MLNRTLVFPFSIGNFARVFGHNILKDIKIKHQNGLDLNQYNINCFDFSIHYLAHIFPDLDTNILFRKIWILVENKNALIASEYVEQAYPSILVIQDLGFKLAFSLPTNFYNKFKNTMISQIGLIYYIAYFNFHANNCLLTFSDRRQTKITASVETGRRKISKTIFC